MTIQSDPKAITQFSTMQALLAGLYDGVFNLREVTGFGTIGLGCGHALEGEVILLNGKCYNALPDGKLVRMQPDDQVPFAEIARFDPDVRFSVDQAIGKDGLVKLITSRVRSANLFIALRVVGQFDFVKIRRVRRQNKPYKPFIDAVAVQEEETIEACSGTLVGFWAPQVYQGVTVAGLHVHFIDSDKQRGGHVIDLAMKHGEVAMESFNHFDIRLPSSEGFRKADLENPDFDAHIRSAEG
jgi:acetolactate decarboxylase